MKIEEFKNEIDSIGFYNDRNLEVAEDDYSFNIKDDGRIIATVNKLKRYTMDTTYAGFEKLTEGLRRDLLDAMYKFASTSLDEREEEKKYYLRHKFLSSSNRIRFLNRELVIGNWFLAEKNYFDGYQTHFTQKEIDEIKEKYDTTLDDFELIEVEDEV